MIKSEQEIRREKLTTIKDQGSNPYPSTSKRDALILDFLENFNKLKRKKKEVTISGRIMTFRAHGKLAFANLLDRTGKLQIIFSQNELGPDKYKFLKNIDIGDIIQVTGTAFITEKKEESLLITDYKLLSKALEPLPDKWHGIKDEETRYRKRYLDILLNPELQDMFRKKAIFWNSMRQFLLDNKFIEVETPVLETTPGGADAEPFITHHNALDIDLYLRISMGELWQKKLMVAGYERTFEIGRQFRNEGIDPEHLQDYTQMEFYMAYTNYEEGMKLVEEMYKYVIAKTFGKLKFKIKDFDLDFSQKWEKIDYVSAIEKKYQINILDADEKKLQKKCQELKLDVSDKAGKGRLMDTLWKQVRKTIAGPAFLVNQPVEVSPLAKRQEKNPKLVERFQVITAGSENGNGYSELNDPIDQENRFKEQAALREAGDSEAQMHDEEFVEALKHGMPPTCGFGVSERLFSFLMDKPIRECVLFPLLRPKNNHEITKKPNVAKKEEKEEKIDFNISREKSLELLKAHMKDEANLNHSLESEAVMRGVAEHLGEDVKYWGALGLLHDVDWEYGEDEHCVKCSEILKDAGYDDLFVETVISHGWGVEDCGKGTLKDFKRETKVQHALAASETITGLIFASALVRPDKKLESVKVKSIKKKIKDKSFAAKVNRNVIKECEQVGLELDEFLAIALKSMQGIAKEIGL
ncbi:MAG: lysine--tRNA ligase [Patescibacteria group bacterium]